MADKKCILTKEQSLTLRGIAIILVVVSHYAGLYGDRIPDVNLQYGLTCLGAYGVDIFFLVSGYGLVKSVTRKKLSGRFLWNRLKNMYLPYLLIAGIIKLYDGQLSGGRQWYQFLTGYDFWYIRNILIFYLAFFLIYRMVQKDWQRLALLTAVLAGYTCWQACLGRADFWYVSNIAFGMGVVLAQFEKKLLKGVSFLRIVQLALLTAGMVWVIKSGLDAREVAQSAAARLKYGSLAAAIWSYFCVQLIGLQLPWPGFLQTAGKLSLELYLLHLFVQERVAACLPQLHWGMQGILAIVATVLAAWLINGLFALLWKAVEHVK